MTRPVDASLDAVETCDRCRFDASRWTDQDAVHTIAHAADLVRFGLEGIDAGSAGRRPAATTGSILERVVHLTEATVTNHVAVATALESPGTHLGASPPPATPEQEELELEPALEMLDNEAARFARVLLKLEPERWGDAIVVDGEPWSVSRTARHLCHDLFHDLTHIADIRATLGPEPPPMAGTVFQLNASRGGVPKTPIEHAVIGFGGVEGDRQATRRHHGRPWQALCLYSAEVISSLADEGHPIVPGATGENITLTGIDWSRLRGGLVVEIGDMSCRLSAPAAPCTKNSQFFLDGDHMRMGHEEHPGWSRWYASVLSPGTVSTGDTVTVSTRPA